MQRERSLRSSERVEPEAFSQRVASKLGDAAVGLEVRFGQVWLEVEAGRIVDVVGTLKTDPELRCSYLTSILGVDWQDDGLQVIYILWSYTYANTVGVGVRITNDDPVVPSITSVFGGADWHERQTHEMFGINFSGHPNLRNLYLPDDFEGNPLRKSFKLASRTYKPWPGAKDPDEAEAGGR